MPEGHIRRIMNAVDLRNAEPLHDALLHHDLPPTAVFFRRLKDQCHRPTELPRLAQILCRSQQHRHMPVMPTGMHLAGHHARILHPRRLQYRQRIHIRPQADHRAIALSLDDRHDACRRNPFMHRIHAHFVQPCHNERRCLVAIEFQFRMRMQMPPPALHLRRIVGDTVNHGHGGLLQPA